MINIETSVVSGHIKVIKDVAQAYNVSDALGQRLIVATDANEKQYLTKTNDDGIYQLYLPRGSYKVMVKTLEKHIRLLTKPEEIKVDDVSPIDRIDFVLEVENRNMDIKHF